MCRKFETCLDLEKEHSTLSVTEGLFRYRAKDFKKLICELRDWKSEQR